MSSTKVVLLVFAVAQCLVTVDSRKACATTNVNIRTCSSTRCSKMGLLKKGDCLSYRGATGAWAKVTYRGKNAWIAKKYLEVEKPTTTNGKYNCYGDVMALRPKGAGRNTSRGSRLRVKGVQASNKMIEQDYNALERKKECYDRAGRKNCVHPAVIAAIASRESRAGRVLTRTGGWGDNGRAWGVMQCDVHTSGLGRSCKKHGWNSCEHIEQMTRKILVPTIRRVVKKKSAWRPEQQLQGGVAAYNFGVSNVWSWSGLDGGTTGDDYSNDVIARAQHLIRKYGW